MNIDRLISDLSLTQGGAIRLEQALDAGLSRAQIKYRIRSGLWSTLIRGSYLVTAMTTVEDHLRAAIASLPDAVVAHEAAAERHGLTYVIRGLATVLVHSQTTHEFPGVIVRRCHDLEPDHVEVVDGLPITTIPRTIVDLSAIVSERNLAAIVDDALSSQVTTIEAIGDVAIAVGRSGKPGTTNTRTVLEARSGSAFRGTTLERRGNALLLTIEHVKPEFEYAIPWRTGRRFDAAYPGHRLAIEWDSIRYHTQEDAFQRDRTRDREAILHGWRVLRFTWEDVTKRSDEVVATVRGALNV